MTIDVRAEQHAEVLSRPVDALAEHLRPTMGPIAILPEPDALFEAAVLAAGGEVLPLSVKTRGIIWLAPHGAADFARVLTENPQVEWVQLPWAGVDSFATVLAEQARPGLLFTSAKGAYAQPVAEHALALALALLRELPKKIVAKTWVLPKTGLSIYGMNVVIIGAGGIAIELLRLLAPFEARTVIVRRSAEPLPGASRTVQSHELAQVLPWADVVIVAAALTGGTRHLIGAPELALMKRSAYLVNIARGALVDTAALVAALDSGAIAGAGVDVTDPEPLPDGHPLWDARNVIITPHSADTPEMTAPLLARRVTRNVEAFLGDGRFVGVVDPNAGY
jgi:phosphoglycerate dehydrogenase-like enzyme